MPPEQNDLQLTAKEFHALLHMTMASDPNPAGEAVDEVVRNLLEKESQRRGYDSWYVAFHEFEVT